MLRQSRIYLRQDEEVLGTYFGDEHFQPFERLAAAPMFSQGKVLRSADEKLNYLRIAVLKRTNHGSVRVYQARFLCA